MDAERLLHRHKRKQLNQVVLQVADGRWGAGNRRAEQAVGMMVRRATGSGARMHVTYHGGSCRKGMQ